VEIIHHNIIPKKSTAKELNHYSPIALTSILFKYLEQIVLKYLLSDIDEPVSVFLEEKEIH